ncbi:hypothetical protein FocTR4_00008427 [Fusarium oxysporum f. sp. cubense]|uniref:SCY1 protein kinase n=1 Tax=Fusarium oxysporum f. sp. cubense TaxID=61366 RepID=A0A5C6SV89_FUSOC|nr:hypothetical protein FocTR4_00008427 [Fusarium oxysporum f. sp. cubense]
MNFLKSAVASAIAQGPPFPYNFGDKVDIDESIWTLYNGTKREDGSNCSIFSFDITTNRSQLPLAKNALKKLRTLRHPGVIKLLDAVETETYIYIATERVVPLRWDVRRKSLSPETIKWGLHSVATYGSLVPDAGRYSPPELARGGWDVIKKNPHTAVDAFNLGTLIFEVFNGDYNGADQAGQTKSIPPSMQSSYKRLCNANPKARISVGAFLDQGNRNGSFFDSSLIKLTEGIDNLDIKTPDEREEFLTGLDELSDDFPEEFFKLKVMPELMKSAEFGGGGPRAVSVVLKIASKLPKDDFDSKITPFIIRLFGNPDRAIRVCLLDSLPLMIDQLSQKIVNDKIFPQLITGFTDVTPVVREQTLKSVLVIITKLSDRTINGDLLKQLARTANDEQPGIRTNTTICLGKIAKHLGTSSRSKVLIAAFTRSLRDPFVHARNASLMALGATAEYFTDEDSACRILPVISPVLIDKEKIVRDSATRTMDIYLQKIKKAASAMPESVLPPPQTNDGSAPRMSTPQPNENTAGGWAGWAISSFTNKISAAAGEIHAESDSRAASPGPTPSPNSEPKKPATSTASSLHRQAVKSPPATLSRNSSHTASVVAESFLPADDGDDAGDSWGDMNDDFDSFDSPGQSSKQPATTTASAATFDDGEPDFAGWLAAQSQKKPTKALPKGLSKSSAAKKPAAKSATKPIAAKKIDMKPKETDDDDGWGDGW